MKSELQGACPTPSAGGNFEGTRGGYPLPQTPAGGGLTATPFTEGIAPTPGGSETPSSELGTLPTITKVKDAPEGGSIGGIGLLESHQSDSTFSR
jgi:hypothetical protein